MKNNISKMLCLDIYLNSLSKSDYNKHLIELNNSQANNLILLSEDLYLQYFNTLLQKTTKLQYTYILEEMVESYK